MKKILSLFFAIIAVFSVVLPASAMSNGNADNEIELALDNTGKAGATYGYATYDNSTVYFNLDNADERLAFEAIQSTTNSRAVQPRLFGSIHVGIEMVGTQYQMYYEVKGDSLLSAGGYMKCKSTALVLATTYHDEKFVQTSLGTTLMTGESSLFSLPSGTEKVKVGWHDVTIRHSGGYSEPSDKYATVKVG